MPSEWIEIEVAKWFAKGKGLDTCFLEGQVMRVTDKAILLKLVDDDDIWIPKSAVIE